jgi:hypothetical protein
MSDRRQVSITDIHELASLYPLGALDVDERIAFEDHLREGCDPCAEDVRFFGDIATLIGESVPATPPPRLRERLLRRVSNSPQVPGILFRQSGLLIARSGEFAWQDLAPGIFLKTLHQDDTRKQHTSLVRMEAGARYPSHSHVAIEELFMLSGDLHVESHVIRAGDYCRGSSGSIHGETFSNTGCLFLMMASQENQILDNRAV